MQDQGRNIDTKRLYSESYRDGAADGGGHVYANELRAPQLDLVQQELRRWKVAEDASVAEIGCGLGHLHRCHKRWRGFEYSDTAVERARRIHGPQLDIVEADARALPIASASVDFLFSFDTLEHIPQVEKAFAEIERILKPRGVGLLSPAWNCRSWTVEKLDMRPYSDLSLRDRIGKFLIPVRENVLFRLLCSLPARARREAQLLLGARTMPLEYRRLSPHMGLWERYGRCSDDDAFVSMDAHAALVYFRSRGWETPSHPTFWKRFSIRGGAILVRKPDGAR